MGWHSIFNFEIQISFFLSLSRTPGIPRETVLNLSGTWLNIYNSNRPFANERRSYWPIACIYFMKNIPSWACLMHIYFWNCELKHAKDTTCERTLCYHKTECVMDAFSFCQLSRDASESLGWACSSSCSADEMRRCKAALRERKREDAVQLNHSLCFRMTDLIWYFVCIYLLI